MVKLTDEYIQRRISVEPSVKDAYLDDAGNAVIIAADGYGWDCGDMEPATVEIIPAGRGAKHFNLSLDRIRPIAVIEATPVELTEDELDEYQEDLVGEAELDHKIYKDAEDEDA